MTSGRAHACIPHACVPHACMPTWGELDEMTSGRVPPWESARVRSVEVDLTAPIRIVGAGEGMYVLTHTHATRTHICTCARMHVCMHRPAPIEIVVDGVRVERMRVFRRKENEALPADELDVQVGVVVVMQMICAQG